MLMFPKLPAPFSLTSSGFELRSPFMSFVKRWIPAAWRWRKNDFPVRLLFEAIFIKFAFDFRWEDLPGIFHGIHPDLPVLSRWKCSSFYGELYNSGFIEGVYRHLYLHLQDYGDYPLDEQDYRKLLRSINSAVILACRHRLSWQNFTALLLLRTLPQLPHYPAGEGRD